MGGGTWSDDVYRRSIRGIDAFEASRDTMSKPIKERRAHQLLNPHGLTVRESRDSEEHPKSNAITVGLDVTGSMSAVVIEIQKSLGNLMNLLLNGKYIEHPQLLFFAIGDATCDSVPFQVSQFESDIRINDQLTKVVLEGGGGAYRTESYEIGLYFAAEHTSIDCFEKRGKKGYLFLIGDEIPYPMVKNAEIEKILGKELKQNIPTENIVQKVKEKYHLFHIIPKGSSHYNEPEIVDYWKKLFGKEFVFLLNDPTAVCELIATVIGLNEEKITLEKGIKEIEKLKGQGTAGMIANAIRKFADHTVKNINRPDANATDIDQPKGKKSKKPWRL